MTNEEVRDGFDKSIRFLVFLFCAAVFIGANTACTDDSTVTVKDVASGNASLEDFTRHAASRLSESRSFEEILGLLNDFRDETGDWNDKETYLILLTTGGGVYIHPKDRELEDQDWSELLTGCSGESWDDLVGVGGGCVMGEGAGSRGYAVSFAAPYVPFSNPDSTEPGFVLVGGLDYTPEADTPGSFEEMVDDLIDRVIAKTLKNEDVSSEDRKRLADTFFSAVTPRINSRDVREESLQSYLEEAYTFMTASFFIPSLFDPVILRRVFRFEGGPWKNLSTYIYITDEKGNVIFNGANRNIEQRNLVRGDYGEEIAEIMERIIETATKKGPTGSFSGGFVEYNWDNPSIEGDEGDGAGGSSPKLAFAKAFSVDKDKSVDNPRIYIFGSGIYLGSQGGSVEGVQ